MDTTNSKTIVTTILFGIIDEIQSSLAAFKLKNQLFSHSIKEKDIKVDDNDNQTETEKELNPNFKSKRIIYKDIILNDSSKQQNVIYIKKEEQKHIKYTSVQISSKGQQHIFDDKNHDYVTSVDLDDEIEDINEEKEEVYIWQMRVLKQQKNDSCGYYSLFNSIMMLNSFYEEKEQDAVELQQGMLCKSKFWYLYNVLLKMLLEHSKSEPNRSYPWNEKYIYNGVLERSYIDYIISSENLFSSQGYPMTILPDWSIPSLKLNRLPIEEVKEMYRISEIFKKSENYSHVFLLGQAIHWITVVINKHGKQSEVIVMDSRNWDLLGSTDEQCITKSNSHPEIPERLRRAYLCSLREPKIIVKILRDCMVGGKDIIKTLLELNLTGFLENYYSHVSLELKSSLQPRSLVTSNLTLSTSPSSTLIINDEFHQLDSIDESTKIKLHKQQLIYWLENYYPPSVIEYTICQVLDIMITKQEHINHYFENKTLELISNWIKDTTLHITHHCFEEIPSNNNNNNNNTNTNNNTCKELSISPLIQRFSTTMKWFHQKFI